jgi:6-phosphogluconolactonase
MMKLTEYADQEMMMIDLANVLAGALGEALMTHETVSLAVPGGTTPGPIFDSLCATDIDWARVHVMLTDERWVPETSGRSNTALIRRRLLTERAEAATFIPFYDGSDVPEDAMDTLAETLAAELPLSVLLLGMGADMHTASLFPGADRLSEGLAANAPLVMAMRAPGAPEPRVTLTVPVLSGAMTTHVVITGADKLAALNAAANLSIEEAPINAVLSNAIVHWAP